jgi:hypothetical protein
MDPEWAQHHTDSTFRNCTESTLELAPAAFPSLPIDQPRPDPPRSPTPPMWWRHSSYSDDWISTLSRSPPSPRNPRRICRSPSPRQARNPSPCQARDQPPRRKHRSPPPNIAHKNAPCVPKAQKSQKGTEIGLIFAPSLLRDPNEIHIVNNVSWKTVEFWYALPPVDLRKAGRAIQGEHDRLYAEGTLQQRAFRPKMDSMREFTTLENLVAQRKTLETKLQLLKYKTAKLLNPKKPSVVLPALSDICLHLEEQRLRSINMELALEVNELLEQAKSKQHLSTIPSHPDNMPLKGVFASYSADCTRLAAVGDQGPVRSIPVDPRSKSKASSRHTREPAPAKTSSDWPVPEDMAAFEDSDATDWDTPDDNPSGEDSPERRLPERNLLQQNSPELREVSAGAWNRRLTPPLSQSSTTSKAAETEAGEPQHAPPIPQISQRKAETGSPQESRSKRQMTELAWPVTEDESLPGDPQVPSPMRHRTNWDFREGELEIETPEGPIWVAARY